MNSAPLQDKLGSMVVTYARPITLMRAERLRQPFPWVGHIPFAFWIIDVMRPRRFVELGTHSGNSFCAFLQSAAATAAGGEFFAVDHWHGDEHAGSYEEEIYQDLHRYVATRHGLTSALLRMTFEEALSRFDDGSVDLLHIDGLHTYEAVKHDFEAWLPKMSDRGIVLLHDTAVRERDFGVYRLFAELAQRFPTFEFLHSHGLGVVQTGTAPVNAPLSDLLRGVRDSQGLDARDYFSSLGNALVDRAYLEVLSSHVERRKGLEIELAQVESRRQQLEAALQTLPRLNDPVENRNSQVPDDGRDSAVLLASGFFDPRAYRKQGAFDGMDDLALGRHYIDTGEADGLTPSVHFDPQFYREAYADAASAAPNMLLHYIAFGRAEGRLPRRPSDEAGREPAAEAPQSVETAEDMG